MSYEVSFSYIILIGLLAGSAAGTISGILMPLLKRRKLDNLARILFWLGMAIWIGYRILTGAWTGEEVSSGNYIVQVFVGAIPMVISYSVMKEMIEKEMEQFLNR